MEGIDLLQNLQNEENRLSEAVIQQQKTLSENLFNFISGLYTYNGLKLMPIQCSIDSPSCSFCDSKEKESPFLIRTGVSFYDKDGRTYNDGSPREEFGAGITLKIYNYGITMSYGSTGEYDHDDKGQMSRAMLVGKLWENEDAIVSIAKATVNMVDYEELRQVRRRINQINEDIKLAEQARERKKILRELYKAKYICKRRIDTKYKEDENGSWVYDEKGNLIPEKVTYKYFNHESITKVTDSNVLTVDTGWRDKHRRNLDQIIGDIQRGSLFLQTELIEEEEAPKE